MNRLLRVLKAERRETEMAQFLMLNEVNLDWVEHVLNRQALLRKCSRWVRPFAIAAQGDPDMELIEARVRKALEDDQ